MKLRAGQYYPMETMRSLQNLTVPGSLAARLKTADHYS